VAICPSRLEVSDLRHTSTFLCILPEDHPQAHQAMYLLPALQVAATVGPVEPVDNPTESVDVGAGSKRRPTSSVVIAWKD
jgi:hypothetical protein